MVRTPQQHTTTLLIGIQASEELNTSLDVLRVYPSQYQRHSTLLSRHSLTILCRYGFDINSDQTSHCALRSLCNISLISRPMRQVFVDV